MRKFLLIGISAIVGLLAVGAMIFAQDATPVAPASVTFLGVGLVEQDGQVIIDRVQTGSPANAADLLIGDVIGAFDGETITSASQLAELVRAKAAGDVVEIEVSRNGEALAVNVTLGSAVTAGRGRGGRGDTMLIPADFDALTWLQHALNADLEATDDGYLVTNVLTSNNPFTLVAGDVVTAVNDLPALEVTPQALIESLTAAQSRELNVTVTRDGEVVTLTGDTLRGGMFRFDFDMGEGSGHGGMFGFGGRHGNDRGGRGNQDDTDSATENNSTSASAVPTVGEPA
jgi:S1-C subfamily serine protease